MQMNGLIEGGVNMAKGTREVETDCGGADDWKMACVYG